MMMLCLNLQRDLTGTDANIVMGLTKSGRFSSEVLMEN